MVKFMFPNNEEQKNVYSVWHGVRIIKSKPLIVSMSQHVEKLSRPEAYRQVIDFFFISVVIMIFLCSINYFNFLVGNNSRKIKHKINSLSSYSF